MPTDIEPTTLAQAAKLPDGAIIYLIRARVTAVYGRKSGIISKGPNQGNPWSLQNIELEEAGTKLTAVLKDREDEIPKTWKGRVIEFAAHQGEKNWTGVYALDDEYKGKFERKIKVTATGEVSLMEGMDSGPAPQRQQVPPPAQQQQPQRQERDDDAHKLVSGGFQVLTTNRDEVPLAPRQPDEKKRIHENVQKATQIANLQLLCLNITANYTAARFKQKTGRELTVQEIHALAMNSTIELMRNGAHWTMPPHQIKDDPRSKYHGLRPGDPGWPEGAIPDKESGLPIDPETGNFIA